MFAARVAALAARGGRAPEYGFTLIFSSMPFPGHQYRLDWRRSEADGNWFYAEQLKSMSGAVRDREIVGELVLGKTAARRRDRS